MPTRLMGVRLSQLSALPEITSLTQWLKPDRATEDGNYYHVLIQIFETGTSVDEQKEAKRFKPEVVKHLF